MKRLLLMILCTISISTLSAQDNKNYVYGIDFSHAKVFAATESVEQFAKAFENINMLIITEPEKYNFSRIVGKRVDVEIEPMLKVVTTCDYTNLKSLNNNYEDPDYSVVVKNYNLPQTTGVGHVLIAKVLNKPMEMATYELISFDIATRDILSQKEVCGKAGGFGLRNYWAGSVYSVIKNEAPY